MTEIPEGELEAIRRTVEEEFPHDPALQQVHVARKIISREAEVNGMRYFDYVKLLAKRARDRDAHD